VVLLDDHNIPTVAFGPGDEKAAYVPNESVEVRDLVEAVFGTAVLIHSVIGIHAGGSGAGRR
jgi:acetylornithine deacetylase/succinyl-diaminopimelate desuccinylase-like protein